MTNLFKFLVLFAALGFIFSSCDSDDTNDSGLSDQKKIVSFQINSVNGNIDANAHKITVTLPHYTNVTNLSPTITVSEKATVSPNSGKNIDFSDPVTYTVTAEDKSTQNYTVTVIKDEFNPIVTEISKTEGLLGGEEFTLQGYFATKGNVVKLIDDKNAPVDLEIVSEDSVKITVKIPTDLAPNEYSISLTSQKINIVLDTKITVVETLAPTILSATIDNKKLLSITGEYLIGLEDLSLWTGEKPAGAEEMYYTRVLGSSLDDIKEATSSSFTYQIPEAINIHPTADYYVTVETPKGRSLFFKVTLNN